MSTEALSVAAGTGIDAGELAVAQRVQQLQALIEAARELAPPGVTLGPGASSAGAQPSNADFAAVLQAATSADASGAAGTPLAAEGTPGRGQGGEYEALIDQSAARNGLDPAVLHGLIQQESGFDPNATSGAGATGLTQLMPATAASLGVADPQNPAESIEGGARYLGQMMSEFGGNTEAALAAYNAGPGAVRQYGGVPPYGETQDYVSKVLGDAEAYRQSHPANVAGVLT